VLAEGKVQGVGPMSELARMDHAAIRPFFDGPRGRAAQEQSVQPIGARRRGKPGAPSSKPR